MWCAEGKWLPKTSQKGRTNGAPVLMEPTVESLTLIRVPREIAPGMQHCEDDHGNSNSSHVKIFLPKKLLECLLKCSSLPKERHR
ncbi:calmodulin-binding transcription activator 1-like [Octodon degus]|uniref:Calmodulin-binding transcription activator 1-like n=1 Tax=Octodon degus TaxID=10160 RepID=A0A6P6DIQ0_OCTDE|nr:calmodulin-binding transcription activator 1-like [Octodon degus]